MNRKKEVAKDPLLEMGMIQAYEFSTELAWKTMKDFLEEKGLIVKNPKNVMREAFSQGYIDNADSWMKLLKDRNLKSHVYDEEIAQIVIENIEVLHFSIIKQLFNFFEKQYDKK